MAQRIVVKLGTSVLTGGSRQLNRAQMVELTRQCAQLQRDGHEVILCTSGAQAAGRAALNFPELPTTLANKQMFAAVGQSKLMGIGRGLRPAPQRTQPPACGHRRICSTRLRE